MSAGIVFIGIIVICILALALVVAYGIYQENRYRKEVYKQFGNAHRDVLLEDSQMQVREGERWGENSAFSRSYHEDNVEKDDAENFASGESAFFPTYSRERASDSEEMNTPASRPFFAFKEESEEVLDRSDDTFNRPKKQKIPEQEDLSWSDPGEKEVDEASLSQEETSIEEKDDVSSPESKDHNFFNKIEQILPSKNHKDRSMVPLKELEKADLHWFNPAFDYLAYVTLKKPQELHSLPRLSNKYRFQIAGYTLDHRFQLAEPIPEVEYKAYVIGLQAISRSGLAPREDLIQFGKQVKEFSEAIGGIYHLSDVDDFYKLAEPMDELCARVDQIIALHLVAREGISGMALRAKLEENGFALAHDGAFYYPDVEEGLFKAVNMDDTVPFTAKLLMDKRFKGFSLLFDITHVPAGREYFDTFMGLAIKLANELGLDLVDDELASLSTDWLKSIGDYIAARQKEMEVVGVPPGSDLARRLFA